MVTAFRFILILLFLVAPTFKVAYAQERNLLPKYGAIQKSEAQKVNDEKFIAAADEIFKGDRKKASQHSSLRGWQYVRQGNFSDAMRRFNQAWLLDNSNGSAIWGMAVFQAQTGKTGEAFKLFAEAEHLVGDDIDFLVDYARLIGGAGGHFGDKALLEDAFRRFAHVYEKAPQHTLNLQNWAITLFYIGNYTESWEKIKLAEATPRGAEVDQNFITTLQSKMPRP